MHDTHDAKFSNAADNLVAEGEAPAEEQERTIANTVRNNCFIIKLDRKMLVMFNPVMYGLVPIRC